MPEAPVPESRGRRTGRRSSTTGRRWGAPAFGALWLCAFAALGSASTVTLEPTAPGFVHESFGVDDGLPVAGILEVLQTRDGYLWFATFDGLVRFDGRRFDVFDGERVPALGSNRIVDLLETGDGTLWIMSQQGHLVRFVDGSFFACGDAREGSASCDRGDAGPAIYSTLYQDPARTVWVGGREGLFRIDGSRIRRVPEFVAPGRVRAILRSRPGDGKGEGRLWVGTAAGVWKQGPGGFEAVDLGRWRGATVSTIAQAGDGTLWLGLDSEAAGRVENGAFETVAEEPANVVSGPDGDIWVGLVGRLLHFHDGRQEEVFRSKKGFYGLIPGRNFVTDSQGGSWIAWAQTLWHDGRAVLHMDQPNVWMSSVMVDAAGTVWVTTTRSGELHAFHPARVATVIDGLPSPTVYPVFEDRDGTLWVGDDYLASLAPGADRFEVRGGDGLPPQRLTEILRDRTGTLWIGTGRGLYTLDGESYDGPYGPPALRTGHVSALTEGVGGVLWVGTTDGLFRREPSGRWSRVDRPNDLPSPSVRVILERGDGTLWLGTDGGGLVRFRDGAFTVVDHTLGLSSNLVRAVWPEPDGRLWIATENHGLDRLDPTTVDRPGGPEISVIGRRDGLFASGIHQIVADGLGNLWMSSNRGIFRARLEDLEAVADGARSHVDCVGYTERDGMLDREANGGIQQAGLRDREGRIWFPTQGGVVRIDPRKALRPVPPPPVHIETLKVGDRAVTPGGRAVALGPRERSVSIVFAAPSFQAPERLRFRYRLVPFDEGWVDAGSRREAFYTKLPPGEYRFEVAVGSESDWSVPATLDLIFAPRFYETGWFLGLCVLSAGVALVGWLRVRDARQRARRAALERLVEERTATIGEQAEALRRMDELKSHFFANVSHELRTPLTLLLGPLRDALDGAFGSVSPALANQIGLAERNGRRLLRLVEQLLDLSRLEAGGLMLHPVRTDLCTRLRERIEAFQPLAERRKIELTGRIGSAPVEIVCDPDELEKVFDNLLVNALKLTPEGGLVTVDLDAPPASERVTVRVRDTGPGIPTGHLGRIFDRFHQADSSEVARSGAGLGLALAREIVELHGGTITAASEEGQGACFEVCLEREPDGLTEASGADGADGAAGAPAPRDRVGSAEDRRRMADAAGEGEERPADGEERGDDGRPGRATVLVVEDNDDVRAYLRRHLAPIYRVIEASDGESGLERARLEVPDLIISDVMMPGLDGNALVRRLREEPALALVPVILLTAKGAPADRLRGLREGADDYLVKPFDPSEVKARVENLITSRRRLRDQAVPPRGLEISSLDATPADQAFLERAQAIIEERLDDDGLTVEALAEALSCDRSHLLRRLKELIDETPSGLIRSLRLQRAAQLLQADAGTVKEVATAVGFKSVAHFSNAFLGYYGERPSAFAARHRDHRDQRDQRDQRETDG